MELTSSEPYWLRKNGIMHTYPSLKEDIETDILIVGAGITGSLLAHQVIKDGYKAVIIDRRDVASGSSSATTSMLQYEIDIPLHKLIKKVGEKAAVDAYWACANAIAELREIVQEVDSDCGFKLQKSLLYASKKSHIKMLKKELECRALHGFPVTWLSEEEILETYGIQKAYAGILSEIGGSVDAYILANDLLDFNVKKGLQVFDRTEIAKINTVKEGVEVRTANAKIIKAKKIVYATGYEVTEMLRGNVVKLLSSFAIVSEQNLEGIELFKDTLFWNTDDPYMYFRTTDDHRLLVGGQDLPFKNPELRNKMLEKQSKKIEDYLEKHLVKFKHQTDYKWAGTFGETKDGLPFIGEHEKHPNSYFVLGFGGNGITFSVAGMPMLSSWLQGQSHKLSEHFRFDR